MDGLCWGQTLAPPWWQQSQVLTLSGEGPHQVPAMYSHIFTVYDEYWLHILICYCIFLCVFSHICCILSHICLRILVYLRRMCIVWCVRTYLQSSTLAARGSQICEVWSKTAASWYSQCKSADSRLQPVQNFSQFFCLHVYMFEYIWSFTFIFTFLHFYMYILT